MTEYRFDVLLNWNSGNTLYNTPSNIRRRDSGICAENFERKQ